MGYASQEKSCQDCGKPIVTRYAKRCTSCACAERNRQNPNQMAKAKEAWQSIYGGERFDVASVRSRLAEYGMSVREAERLMAVKHGTLQRPMERGYIGYRVRKLLCERVLFCDESAIAA